MVDDSAMRKHFPRKLTLSVAVAWALAIVILGIGGCAANRVTVVDDAALKAADADPANWLTYGRNYSEQRFSGLKQIDEQTVSRLGLAWSFDLRTLRGLEPTPLVQDGVLYTTSAWRLVYAFPAPTAHLVWHYDPRGPKDHSK